MKWKRSRKAILESKYQQPERSSLCALSDAVGLSEDDHRMSSLQNDVNAFDASLETEEVDFQEDSNFDAIDVTEVDDVNYRNEIHWSAELNRFSAKMVLSQETLVPINLEKISDCHLQQKKV